MRKLFFPILILTFNLSSILLSQGTQDFTLINKTGLTIDQLYISAADKAEWEEDVLSVEVIAADSQSDIKFSPVEETCIWDLRIIDEAGDALEWNDIDLCEAVSVTLYWEDGQAIAEIDKGEGFDEGDFEEMEE